MAYRADIEIGVRGVRYLDELQNKLTQVSKTIEQVNRQNVVIRRTIAGAASATPMGPGGSGVTSASAQAAALAVERRVGEMRRNEAQAAIKSVKDRAVAENYIAGVISRRLQAKQQELAVEQKITAETLKQATASRRKVAGNAISSGIIGGGFPLLFGQGPAAAAGGALGGLAGGLLGGGFGFALSIAGTAIGDLISQTDKLNVAISGLNSTLATTSSTTITTAEDVSRLAQNLRITKEEAIDLVAAFSQFNQGNTREALARGFGAVGGAATFEAIAKAGVSEKDALDAIFSLRKQIGNETANQLALQLRAVGATQTQAALLKVISERNIANLVAQQKTVQYSDRLLSVWENVVAATAAAAALAARFIAKMQEGSLIKLPFLDRIQQVLGRIVARSPEAIAGQRGNELEKQLRAEQQAIIKALRQETGGLITQANIAEQLSPGRQKTGPESRLGQLKAEYDALVLIGNQENAIRDFLFQGQEVKAAQADLALKLAVIDRERLQALDRANYAEEKIYINKIAQKKELYAIAESEDKVRAIRQKQFEDQLSLQEAVQNTIKPFTDMRMQQELQAQYSKTYLRLVTEGVLPAEAERIANFEKLVGQKTKELELEIALVKNAIEKAKAEQLSTDALEKRLKLLTQSQTALTGAAAAGPGEGRTSRERLQDEIAVVQGQLNTLLDPINQITTAAEGIGLAFSDSFKGIVSGTMTAQEALANFFQNVADQFLDMAAQMIAKWIQLAILNSVLKLFPTNAAIGTAASGGYTLPSGGGYAEGFSLPQIIPGMATGGPVTGGMPYMVGERGPELFVPGRSGSIVPNNQLGGGDNVSVVVNVDAKGTNVQGNDQQGNQLGRAISAAVQAELVKQKRPGGLLAV